MFCNSRGGVDFVIVKKSDNSFLEGTSDSNVIWGYDKFQARTFDNMDKLLDYAAVYHLTNEACDALLDDYKALRVPFLSEEHALEDRFYDEDGFITAEKERDIIHFVFGDNVNDVDTIELPEDDNFED